MVVWFFLLYLKNVLLFFPMVFYSFWFIFIVEGFFIVIFFAGFLAMIFIGFKSPVVFLGRSLRLQIWRWIFVLLSCFFWQIWVKFMFPPFFCLISFGLIVCFEDVKVYSSICVAFVFSGGAFIFVKPYIKFGNHRLFFHLECLVALWTAGVVSVFWFHFCLWSPFSHFSFTVVVGLSSRSWIHACLMVTF